MDLLLTILIGAPALVLLVLACFYALEVAGALLPFRNAGAEQPGQIAVVIPAHNEAGVIEATLADVRRQLRPGDRVLVVADNCTDATAEVAMRAGASVLIRTDDARRGKGYALQFALDSMRETPPAVVVFVDADCRLGDDALLRVAGAAAASARPAQALYLMEAGEDAPPARAISAFAWLLMNRVRMSGLYTLFDTCRLTGAGMAVPWPIAETLDLASGEIVEDLALGVALTQSGHAPVFCRDALVLSEFPDTDDAATTQRARWEHGSLRLAMRRAPGLLVEAVRNGDIRLAATAFDLAIPPLTVFGAAIAALGAGALLARFAGAHEPLDLMFSTFTIFTAATIVAWIAYGRRALPPRHFGAAARYLGDKIAVYGKRGRESAERWTRTARKGESTDDGAS